MKLPFSQFALGTLLCGALLGGCVAGPAPSGVAASPSPEPEVSLELARQVFDSVWSHVARTHYDPEMNGVDWEGARSDLRPTDDETFTRGQLRSRVQQLLERIGDSHYTIIPGEAMSRIRTDDEAQPADAPRLAGDPLGVHVRRIGLEFFVTSVETGSPAEVFGIQPGWKVEQAGPANVVERMAAFTEEELDARTSMLLEAGLQDVFTNPQAGTPLSLRFRDGAGELRELEIIPSGAGTPRQGLGTILPPMAFEFSHRRVEVEGGCVGVIAWSVWLIPLGPQFQRAMADLESCGGIVIDLRGNLGGVVGTMTPLAGRFVADTVLLGRMTTRDNELVFRATPARVTMDGTLVTPFQGPLAILVDGLSMSTSELFASGLQTAGRARVFGDRTPGMALPAQTIPLPGGDYFMFAFADWVDGSGRRIEGVGVTPDTLVPLEREALLDGRDLPLEAALDWIVRSAPHSTPY